MADVLAIETEARYQSWDAGPPPHILLSSSFTCEGLQDGDPVKPSQKLDHLLPTSIQTSDLNGLPWIEQL